MAFCIRKFSVWFCFVHSSKESSLELDSVSLCQLPINVNQLKEIIQKIFDVYKDEFEPFWGNLRFAKKVNTYEIIIKLILSKCVQLSTPASYLHFLLVCTFIYFLICRKFDQQVECFTLVHVASQCLIAVYDRCYRHFFEFGAFQNYYTDLNYKLSQRSSAQDLKTMHPFDRKDLIKLMTIFKNIEEVEFNLTKHEQLLFAETKIPIPAEHSHVGTEELKNVPESDKKLKEKATQTEANPETDSKEETIQNNPEINAKDKTIQNNPETDSKEETIQNNPGTDSKEETIQNKPEKNAKEETIQNDSEINETSSKEVYSTDDFESDDSSPRESVYVSTGGLKTDKELFKYANQPCPICDSECFKFAFAYVADVFWEKES